MDVDSRMQPNPGSMYTLQKAEMYPKLETNYLRRYLHAFYFWDQETKTETKGTFGASSPGSEVFVALLHCQTWFTHIIKNTNAELESHPMVS